MPIVPFNELVSHAERNSYAIGYFESWNLESLLAAADAAEKKRSPVILGFSGISLPHPDRIVHDNLSTYATFGTDVCSNLSVPACLIFNESADMEWLFQAVDLNFGMVMFTDERLSLPEQTAKVRELAVKAHPKGIAVEGELTPLKGAGGEAVENSERGLLTDVKQAYRFAEDTGIDALAVDIGQVHVHGRVKLSLDIDHLRKLKAAVDLPLVLHGASSVSSESISEAVKAGISKINVGSILKRTFFNACREASQTVPEGFNPYNIIGSGLREDVLVHGRLAMQRVVEDLMDLFSSSGKA